MKTLFTSLFALMTIVPLAPETSILEALRLSFMAKPTVQVPMGFAVEEFAPANNPMGMVLDEAGNLVFVEVTTLNSSKLRKITIEEGVNTGVMTLAELGTGVQYITRDEAGNIYAAESTQLNGDVLRIGPGGSPVEVFIPGTGSYLNDARGITTDADENLVIVNNILSTQDSRLDGFVSKFFLDTEGNADRFISSFIAPFPNGRKSLDLAYAPNGDLYITSDDAVSKVTFNGNRVATFDPDFALLPNPENTFAAGIAVNSYGEVYVSQVTVGDNSGGKIYHIDTEGNPTLFADGLYQPRKLLFDSENQLYISDYSNNMIYRITSVADDNQVCGGIINQTQGIFYHNTKLQQAVDEAVNEDMINLYAMVNYGDFLLRTDKTVFLNIKKDASFNDVTQQAGSLVIDPDPLGTSDDELIVSIRSIAIEGGRMLRFDGHARLKIGSIITEAMDLDYELELTEGIAVNITGDLAIRGNLRIREGATLDVDRLIGATRPGTPKQIYGELTANSVDVSTGGLSLMEESLLRAKSTSGGFPGGPFIGAPNTTIRRGGLGQGGFEIVPSGEEAPGTTIILPIGITGEFPEVDAYVPVAATVAQMPRRGTSIRINPDRPFSIEDIISLRAGAVSGSAAPDNGISSEYVDYVYSIQYLDVDGSPNRELLDLDLYFPADLQTGPSVMENPVVVVYNGNRMDYYLAEATPGVILQDGEEVANPDYNKVSVTGVKAYGLFAIFGFPSCTPDNKKMGEGAQICRTDRDGIATTVCIPKDRLLRQLIDGAYSGPCMDILPTLQSKAAGLSPTAVPASSTADLMVFPNPAQEIVQLRFATVAAQSRQVRLLDLNGRLVRQVQLAPDVLQTQLQVDGLAKGMYYLQVIGGEEEMVRKVVVSSVGFSRR